MTNPAEAVEVLEPCPFCGGAATLQKSRAVESWGDWEAGCYNETCLVEPSTFSCGTDGGRDAVIRAWNRRAPTEGETE